MTVPCNAREFTYSRAEFDRAKTYIDDFLGDGDATGKYVREDFRSRN